MPIQYLWIVSFAFSITNQKSPTIDNPCYYSKQNGVKRTTPPKKYKMINSVESIYCTLYPKKKRSTKTNTHLHHIARKPNETRSNINCIVVYTYIEYIILSVIWNVIYFLSHLWSRINVSYYDTHSVLYTSIIWIRFSFGRAYYVFTLPHIVTDVFMYHEKCWMLSL